MVVKGVAVTRKGPQPSGTRSQAQPQAMAGFHSHSKRVHSKPKPKLDLRRGTMVPTAGT